MKISCNWLRDYVDVKNSAKQVAEWLTMAGLEVTAIEGYTVGFETRPYDSILEIEVTTNRPDWLSVVGVAREVSAITAKRLKLPRVPAVLPILVREKQIDVEVEDKILCPRYTARVVDQVRVGASPDWLKSRLEAIGVRPVNNVVDVTNFCLFELGQPLHAFDYDKLSDQAIIVRRAKKGETIITIDKTKRELDTGMLIIADKKRPIAIAGVMGGLDTAVTEATKTILIESAYFEPISVRKTQKILGLSTDSSYRFERGVDFEGVLFASNRTAHLIAEICGGKIGVLKDVGIKVAKKNVIKFSVDKMNRTLNLTLTPVSAKKLLASLDLKVSAAQEELRVEPPSFRIDLKREEDLIEEIARRYGYDRIPTTIPRMIGHSKRKDFGRLIEELTRESLIAEGLDEVITYSLMDRRDLANITPHPNSLPKGEREYNFSLSPEGGEGRGEGIITLSNPLSSQQEVMRPTLIPGILNTARFNINRKLEDIRIFELSKVYSRLSDKAHKEDTNLAILISGRTMMSWRQKSNVDFLELKGIIEMLFERLRIPNCRFVDGAAALFYPEKAAKIIVNDAEVGVIGEVKKDILNNFDVKKEVFLCEIKFEELVKFASIEKKVAPLPKFLPTKRDVSIVIEKNICVKDLLEAIKEEGGVFLKEAELSDEYFGEQIASGKRGLTFSIEYLSSDRQLTDEEIEKVHNKIREKLADKFGATIR